MTSTNRDFVLEFLDEFVAVNPMVQDIAVIVLDQKTDTGTLRKEK